MFWFVGMICCLLSFWCFGEEQSVCICTSVFEENVLVSLLFLSVIVDLKMGDDEQDD